jgi:hypothetical protein
VPCAYGPGNSEIAIEFVDLARCWTHCRDQYCRSTGRDISFPDRLRHLCPRRNHRRRSRSRSRCPPRTAQRCLRGRDRRRNRYRVATGDRCQGHHADHRHRRAIGPRVLALIVIRVVTSMTVFSERWERAVSHSLSHFALRPAKLSHCSGENRRRSPVSAADAAAGDPVAYGNGTAHGNGAVMPGARCTATSSGTDGRIRVWNEGDDRKYG